MNPTYGGTAQQARVRAAAQALAANLVKAGGGITAFLAQEIFQSLREALAILATPALHGALGARDTWGVIGAIDRIAGVQSVDPTPFARRGKAGMTVLSWLSEAGSLLDGPGQPLVALDHPVIGAAVEWLQSSLAIGENAPAQGAVSGAPGAPPPPAALAPTSGSTSPWAAIGT